MDQQRQDVIAYGLRKGGATYTQIAQQLTISEEEARACILRKLSLPANASEKIVENRVEIDRLETMLLTLWPQANEGNQGAVSQVMKINERLEKLKTELGKRKRAPKEDTETAFPASEKTPGQKKSRATYAELLNRKIKHKWWQDFLALIDAGLTWRKAVYVAWAVSPVKGRWPRTLEDLATEFLGLHSARTIRKWRATDPKIDKLIAEFRMAPVMDHLSDSLAAMMAVAARHDPSGNRDRDLHFQIAGLQKTRLALDVMAKVDHTEVPYKVEILDLLRSGKVTPEQLIQEMGLDIATELLESAGIQIPKA